MKEEIFKHILIFLVSAITVFSFKAWIENILYKYKQRKSLAEKEKRKMRQ